MSGRRLLTCTSCKQKYYVPTGAKCPYGPGETIPPNLLPGNDADAQPQELSDSETFTEDEDDDQAPGTPSYNGSEFELPSGQPDPLPSTSTQPPASPISLQQFVDTTTTRIRQLEQERTQMLQMQESLITQQKAMQEERAAIRQQWQVQPLQPNRDVRAKNQGPRLTSDLIATGAATTQPSFPSHPLSRPPSSTRHRSASPSSRAQTPVQHRWSQASDQTWVPTQWSTTGLPTSQPTQISQHPSAFTPVGLPPTASQAPPANTQITGRPTPSYLTQLSGQLPPLPTHQPPIDVLPGLAPAGPTLTDL